MKKPAELSKAAATLGKIKTPRKAAAARRNGKEGGRGKRNGMEQHA